MESNLPKLHRIKLDIAYYDDVMSGTKTFEIRKDDRDYEVGDLVIFIPADHGIVLPPWGEGEERIFRITYLIGSSTFGGIREGYVVFGISEVKEAKPQ